MPDAQLTNKLSPRETVRPRCPMCEASMDVLRIVPGRPGLEHRTLRCTKCGTIFEAQTPADPIDANALGWLHSGLYPPQ
jgi:tRNA(Ile2) C34 agmatinyltransferase TiaS